MVVSTPQLPTYNLIRYEIGDHIKNPDRLRRFYLKLMLVHRRNLEAIHTWFVELKREKLENIGLVIKRPKCEDGSHYIDIALLSRPGTYVVTRFISASGGFELSSSLVNVDDDGDGDDLDEDDNTNQLDTLF